MQLNSLLINCRSVKTKLSSLVENILTNETTFAVLTETWLYKGDKQIKKQLNDIFDEHSLGFIRKDRNSKGGGVAIMFDSKVCELKKLKLKSMRGHSSLEILSLIHI